MQKTSNMEHSGGDRVENLAACQKLLENRGQEMKSSQLAIVKAEDGPNDLDMKQDSMDKEQAGLNTKKVVDKSVDDQVASEKRAADHGRPGEKVEEEVEASTMTKAMQGLKVVDQDTYIRAETHEESWSKTLALEEIKMPPETQEKVGMPAAKPWEGTQISVDGQKQSVMTTIDQGVTKVRAEAHEEKRMKKMSHGEVGIAAEAQEKVEMAVQSGEEAQMPEGEEQLEMTVGQKDTEVRAKAWEEKGMEVVVRKEVGIPSESQEKVGMPEEPKEEAQIPLEGEVLAEMSEDREVGEVRAKAHEEKVAHKEVGMPAESREEAQIPVEGEKRAEMSVKAQEEIEMEIQDQADIRIEAQEKMVSRGMTLDEAEIERPSPRSSVESEKDQVVEEESTAKTLVQKTKLEQTAESDEEQQKIMERLMAEISSHVCVKDVHIQPLQRDFSEFSEVQVDRGRFGHVIEVYGFSTQLTAEDLMEPFKEYRDRGFRLQWVDQTHALGIFSSPEDAYAASSQMHPAMKFRPLSQGSRQSKIRAYEKAAFMYPHMERPRTDMTVARRLVTRALALPKELPDQPVVET
ncbi:hypothetical protein GDO78_004987 [Eleutherodactylus coqui]|uniref:Uncharacterized protein n=3 Tax=Eleutherodactylus coqui TaxID=57060 RepID=A0A8J6KEH9_ELECQ|nr:hypothetical protein GDO78_004987 [Eleutherodactylus coqui]